MRRDYSENELKAHLDKVDECYQRHYSLEKFSFMPITDGLQLIKGADEYDRLDVIVYKLSKYYETGILRNAKYRNREALETYLKLFYNFYE